MDTKIVTFSSDNYGISGNYRTAIHLSIKLSTPVLNYLRTKLKLKLTYETL